MNPAYDRLIVQVRVREGSESVRCLCIVGTVAHWLLLLLLTLTAHLDGCHRERLTAVSVVCSFSLS